MADSQIALPPGVTAVRGGEPLHDCKPLSIGLECLVELPQRHQDIADFRIGD
jgi:hypothetical protein